MAETKLSDLVAYTHSFATGGRDEDKAKYQIKSLFLEALTLLNNIFIEISHYEKNNNNNLFELIDKAKQPSNTPLQEEINGTVKPVTKGTFIYIEKHKFIALKKLAADKKHP